MNPFRQLTALCAVLGIFAGGVAQADLYQAGQAFEKKEYEKAFQLFRELAELGNTVAQENLAIMYVNGEGVKRDNVSGYAWASIATDNGVKSEALQNILTTLEPHVSPTARIRINELKAQYGAEGLKQSLLPNVFDKVDFADREPCQMIKHATPEYPADAQSKGVQGQAYVEFTVMPDGRARNPRVVYSVPGGYFEEASRTTILKSSFAPARTKEGPVPCTMAVMFRYVMSELTSTDYPKLGDYVKDMKAKAEAGDPGSQMVYGLLVSGLPQLKQSRADAMPWFVKSAQAGLPSAQYLVGVSAMKGWGCQCEEPKGMVWLHKAASADQSDAQVSLANYLLRGQPTPEDAAKARTWLERAVASGNRDGKFYLAALLAAGPDPAMRDPQRSLDLLKSVLKDMDADPTAFEIRAAANAMLGNFDAALKDQSKALRMAQKLQWDVAPQQARLKNYQDKQSFTGDLFSF